MSIRHLPFVFAVASLLPLSSIAAQSDSAASEGDKAEGDKSDEKKTAPAPRIRKYADWVKGKERIDGFFAFHRDPVNGDTFMEIRPDQIGQEFIYFNYTVEGTSLDGLRRLGALDDNYVLSLRRRFNRIDFIRQDSAYSYDEGSTLDGQRANVLSPFLASAVIVAEDDQDKRVVIRVNDLFQGRDLLRMGNASSLGRLLGIEPGTYSKEKSNIRTIRNYPDNSEVLTEYVFDYPKTSSAVSGTLALQHSFVRMPKGGFEPRIEDPRIGFFTTRNTNLSAIEGNPARDRIHRWRLEKKNPEAALSEPVKPITYWIEKTTPREYRDIIREAALRWNAVFEGFGFKDAIRVEVQPDDATWDAGDVNRNVIRWVASPVPVYAGYGPTAVNPRTGEIIGADIALEHATIQRWLRQNVLAGSAADGAAAVQTGGDPLHHCNAGESLHQAIAFAAVLARAGGVSAELRKAAEAEIVRQGVAYLVVHEIGHTLGLTHNMKGSHYKPISELNAPEDRYGANLSNSIMDYPQVNLAGPGRRQGAYFPTQPGPYDRWALAYAYDPALSDAGKRAQHVALSGRPEHAFANDGDSMGLPGMGMDPRVIPYDLSSQPVEFASGQLDLIRTAQRELVQRTVRERGSWDELRQMYVLLNGMYRQNVTAITRYVGGVYVDRAGIGEQAVTTPFVPVPLDVQKRSMKLLDAYLFAPAAMQVPEQLGAYLQAQRRGFDFYGKAQDAPLHADILALQSGAIAHLLHANTLTRMTDAGLYGNRYTVSDMLNDLTASVFDADIGGSINTMRQNLQTAYVGRLVATLGGRTDSVAKGALFGELKRIDAMLRKAERRGDARTQTHRRYVRHTIAAALDIDRK